MSAEDSSDSEISRTPLSVREFLDTLEARKLRSGIKKLKRVSKAELNKIANRPDEEEER